MNAIPTHLHSTYKMLTAAFGNSFNQHDYEGVIRLLYSSMSNENLAQVLSYFVKKAPAVVDNDIPKYYNADENNYFDVRERLIACGYEEWLNEDPV